MFYTYSIKNIDTGKFYIGSRTNKCMLNRRPEDDLGIHYFSSTTDEELKQAIKDGRVEYHVLQEYDDRTICWKAEQQLIALYWKFFGSDMSYNHFYSNYNGDNVFSAAGKPSSFKGKHHSKESKEKLSEARKGKPSPNKGKHLSKETKEKMSVSKKNKYVGKKWYNNGIEEIILYPEDAEEYLNKGYIAGRLQSVMRNVADKHVGNTAWNKGKKGLYKTSKETKDKLSKVSKGKPKPKYYWQTPEGEIIIMAKCIVVRFHTDWVLLGPVE